MQIASSSALYDQIYQMSLPFEGKETEFNWGQRERNIVQLRCIIRGNTPTDFRNEFITCLKEVSESICKAVLSLRTTLSTHGCQLIKECAIILGADFDPLIDNYMPTLSKLTLATKNIASTNANIAICSMYANCSFHTKLIHRVQQSSVEKNYQPRSYSGIWIQILLVRFSSNSQFSSDSCTKVITKLLSDQNPTVRQVAKDTFWIHWQKFPAQGEAMLGRLDGNIVRALERSRPKQTAPPTATSTSSSSVSDTAASKARSKPSIRESIILKNRELKEKQRAQTLSRPSSNLDFHNPPSHSQHELKNQRSSSSLSFNRLGGAKRNFTYDPSSTSSHSLSGGNSTISKNNRVASVGVQSTSKQPSFDIQADPILKFLSSDLLEEKLEGISLLKYAILGDEELSNQISVLITKISLKNPMLLKPLFLGSNELLRKTFKYFESPEDFIRVICILRTEVDASQVDLITSFVLCEEVYQSFAAILSYATKITNILNNGDLVMQMIRYKTTIFQTSIQFLNLSLERMPISDASYSLLIQELFEMVNLLRSTNPFNSLIELLTKFNNINHELFERNLQKTSISIRDELKQSLNRIDASTSRLEVPDLQSEKTSYDMTRVFLQPDSQPQASPLKEPSDFTMIMPTFNKNEFVFEEKKLKLSPTNLDAEPQFDTVVEDNIDMDDDSKDETCGAEINNNNQDHIQNHDDNMEVDDNIFVEKNESNGRRSDLFAKFNKETSTELVNDFAQVQICEPMVSSSATRDDNPIQSFIDRLDPLNKISNKKKQIQIYHDESDKSCSPQKQRDYNYGEMNWFNYLVAKARADSTTSPATTSSISSGDSERSIENFKSLCSNLSLSKIQSRNFIEILNYLQDRKHSATVKVFIDSQGHALLEDSLWKFFDKQTSSTLNPNFLLSGLIVLKQMLVNRLYLNLEKLWSNILLLNEICGTSQLDSTASTEIDIAINEVFDEILVGSFSSQEILSIFSSSFNNINGFSQHKLIFVLESFNKLVSMNTFGFLITDQIIAHVDNSLRRYLSNESVVTRRTVVLIYGKLLKADRTIEVNKMENSNEKNVMENILQNLTVPQKKLIEYYSQQ